MRVPMPVPQRELALPPPTAAAQAMQPARTAKPASRQLALPLPPCAPHVGHVPAPPAPLLPPLPPSAGIVRPLEVWARLPPLAHVQIRQLLVRIFEEVSRDAPPAG